MSGMMLVFVAIIGGMAVAVQAQFVGLIEQALGTVESVFITYVGGALLVSLWVLRMKGGNLAEWQTVPRYAFAAGALGLVIIASIACTVPQLGLAKVLTIIVGAQLVVSLLIDHYGFLGAVVRPMDITKMLGVGVMFLGVWLTLR